MKVNQYYIQVTLNNYLNIQILKRKCHKYKSELLKLLNNIRKNNDIKESLYKLRLII